MTSDMTEFRCVLLWTLLVWLVAGVNSWGCAVAPLCAGGNVLSQQPAGSSVSVFHLEVHLSGCFAVLSSVRICLHCAGRGTPMARWSC